MGIWIDFVLLAHYNVSQKWKIMYYGLYPWREL